MSKDFESFRKEKIQAFDGKEKDRKNYEWLVNKVCDELPNPTLTVEQEGRLEGIFNEKITEFVNNNPELKTEEINGWVDYYTILIKEVIAPVQQEELVTA